MLQKEAIMVKGYLVAHIRVHDKEGFEKFKEMSGPAISEYGGKVLVRNPSPDIREGGDSGVAIVIEFESIQGARKFYESDKYNEARAVRELAAETDLILVEGM
jgi:uncharacterized protein (DUF1330 family)